MKKDIHTKVEQALEAIGRDEQGKDISLTAQRETRRRVAALLAEKKDSKKGTPLFQGLRVHVTLAMAATAMVMFGLLAHVLKGPAETGGLTEVSELDELDQQIDSIRYDLVAGLSSFERKLGKTRSVSRHDMASRTINRRILLRAYEIEKELDEVNSRHDG